MRNDTPFMLLFSQQPPGELQPWHEPFDATAAAAELFPGTAQAEIVPQVLLVATSRDPNVDVLGAALVRRGVPTLRLDGDAVVRDARLAWRCDERGARGSVRLPTATAALDSVQAVLWRWRPGGGPRLLDPEEAFRRGEAAAALEGLEGLLPEARWVDRLSAVRASGSKLAHLRLAGELGFAVPRTLVTNDSDEARAFVASSPSTVVKAFSWVWNEPDPRTFRRQLIFAHRLRPEDEVHLGRVESAPCIFQEEVPRRREWRVTVVGGRLFPAAIDAAAPQASVDWRDPACRASFRAGELPDAVAERCLAFTRRLHLSFATMDLIETPEGDHVFLDFNVLGNWLYVEGQTGLQITEALASLLAHGARESSGGPG